MPALSACSEPWRRHFEERGLPVLGNNIGFQAGATITHRRQPPPQQFTNSEARQRTESFVRGEMRA